ncbi:MAG: ABC transporter permease [Muribaculaceae bacterium]
MMLLYLIVKEFKQMLRNVLLPVIFVLLPLLLTNLIPRIATQEISGLRFVAVDNDHSTASSRIIHKIDASAYIDLYCTMPTFEAAMHAINNGEADMILEIPQDYERSMVRGGMPQVQVMTNATNGVKGSMAGMYVSQILAQYLQDEGVIIKGNDGDVTASTPSVRFYFNNLLDYKVFMIPAIFTLLLILIVGFLPALNIVSEKEKGTIEQINVSPIGKMTFILSKIIPYAIVGLLMTAEALLASRAIYGIMPRGSVALLLVSSVLFAVVVSSIGLIISNFSHTLQQAALTMFFFLVIFILMSGLLTPIASMPQWAQIISVFNPTRYFIEVARGIFIKGCTASNLLQQYYALAFFAITGWICAIASYRKKA